jgi:regulator of nucleoside diphosphate kinase
LFSGRLVLLSFNEQLGAFPICPQGAGRLVPSSRNPLAVSGVSRWCADALKLKRGNEESGMKQILISEEDYLQIEKAISAQRSRDPERDRDALERLEQEIVRAKKVAHAKLPADVVALDREVTVVDLEDNAEETYCLVLPNWADVSRRRISVLAPIGAALLGYREGDQIEWPVPDGLRKLRIKSVSCPSDDAANSWSTR